MDLHLNAQLTADDLADAQILHGVRRAFLSYLLVITSFFALFGLALGMVAVPILGLAAIAGYAASIVAGWWTVQRAIVKRAKKIFAQQKSLQAPLEIWISAAELFLKTEKAESHTPWDDFHKWKANNKTILVYHSDVIFHMFPRRWFASDAEFQSFQDLLSKTIGPAGQARKRS
jgi:hypothetical protein